jgi:hypothetical protein
MENIFLGGRIKGQVVIQGYGGERDLGYFGRKLGFLALIRSVAQRKLESHRARVFRKKGWLDEKRALTE